MAPRSRTFTGCGTCRSRHLKCDEKRPSCGNCTRLNRPCRGYTSDLVWLSEKELNGRTRGRDRDESAALRYPLFTEDERSAMCQALTDSTAGSSAGKLVDQLDVECEAEGAARYGLTKGPFHVFDVHEVVAGGAEDTPATDSTESQYLASASDETIEEIARDFMIAPMDAFEERSFQLPDMPEFGEAVQAYDGVAMWDYGADGLARRPSQTDTWALQQYLSPGGTYNLGLNTSDGTFSDISLSEFLKSPSPIPQSIPQNPTVGSINLPEDASFLLRHSRELFDGCSKSTSARKSPWQLLALPNALETFAELSIFSDASHSRLASFFALLANTAFHLGRRQTLGSECARWRTSGQTYAQMAKLHLQNALRSEMQPASSKNYKQLLMSLIAMATAAMYHEPKSMSAFLIDAERLIRLRGIPNPKKSFKTRLLHHVYTHLRIIFESLSISKDDEDDEVSSPPLTTQGTLNVSELRKFRMSAQSLNAGLDHSILKLSDLGYNDIHLEVQGNWAQTLFPQIYGIPESLLTLLSQTICIANDKKRLDRIAASNPVLSVAISKHIKTLENNLWAWSPTAEQGLRQLNTMICERNDAFEQDPLVQTLVAAMHDAVLIYFYRRVTNIHAMMMQDLVRKVLERLEPWMMDARDPDFATTVAWPYLIASSEAATPELQQLALRCLNSIDAQGLPFVLENATNVAQQVWQRRQQLQDFTISWMDVIAT